MNYIEVIYYVISVLSIILYVLSVQFKEKKYILISQIGASCCYFFVYLIKGLYYGIMGAWVGVSIEVLEELKNITFIGYEKKNEKIPVIVLLLFLFLLVLVSIIFYDGLASLLPLVINVLLFTSTYFKPKIIRIVMIFTGIMWCMYNMSLGAYIVCIGNILEVVSAIISLCRYKEEKAS